MRYYYNPEVRLLLIPQSDQKVTVTYTASQNRFKLPLIGPRPPFYTNPIYQPYYTKL
ncbi:hypothetical protein [Ornithinibacillus bavariensis]|uniref:Uncharacterized protein n=1 Tax=Ornithinibacillus bavariensis TaxID=545502 RepID=A0A919X7H0_9BACI|nr:hypothetical protein [Ornithinibacillus bavariensis]GIO25867.1 hypothetical protein J43TS3_04780 [Ornithinibacillus bavariensis]